MKCQRCPKQATLHITEVLGDERFEELHLCEECAKKYLYEPTPVPPQQAGKKSQKAAAGVEAADDLGGKLCEACGIKFVEFRNTGRLGCPHDYDAFKDDLVQLLESNHAPNRHHGKLHRPQLKPQSHHLDHAGLRKN